MPGFEERSRHPWTVSSSPAGLSGAHGTVDLMASERKNRRGGKTKSTAPDAPSVALQRRARQAAQQAAKLAASGFPSFDQLRVRTGKFFARVEKKLEEVPDERRQTPPATIAAPAALQYALLGEGSEVADLREMFENLLAASMDRDTASSAHPAFVSMISQLTPDEARILKSIDRNSYEYFDIWDNGKIRTMLGSGLHISGRDISMSVANFVRSGIITLHTGAVGSRADTSPAFASLLDAEFPDDVSTAWKHYLRYMQVTVFGQQFLDICVRHRA